MAATDAQATALGYALPQGTDSPRLGDDAIRQNAKASAGLVLDLQSTAGIAGTGSPLGKVTPARAGITYTDTAGTNGAWQWISTGTTNASWIVTAGDTGRRNVPADSGIAATGNIWLQRAGNVISVWVQDLRFAAGVGGAKTYLWATIPDGFRPAGNVNMYAVMGSAGPTRFMPSRSGGLIIYGTAASTADLANVEMTYLTPDAWPITLPGTPA